MSPELNSRSVGLVAVSLAWAVFLTVIGSPEVLLFTIPVFMLAAPLALGRYVGDDLISSFRSARPRSRRAVAAVKRLTDLPATFAGSLLIALNLAGRAPPASVT